MTDPLEKRTRKRRHARHAKRRGFAVRFTPKVKLLGLALALMLTACLTAVAARGTNAYFSDTKSGTMTGTLGSWGATAPYRLQAGTSKARHWDLKGSQRARVLPIAQYDSTGVLFLDFGEEVRHNSNASPDVFRLVSLVDEPRAVSFSVSGSMAAFVTVVRLRDGTSGILQGRATESVYIKISVPDDVQPGDYSGTLTVHVDGWPSDAQLHMIITVRATSAEQLSLPATSEPAPSPPATMAPAETPTPTAAPSASTPAPTPAATDGANGV
jgi:cell division septation protein DedD